MCQVVGCEQSPQHPFMLSHPLTPPSIESVVCQSHWDRITAGEPWLAVDREGLLIGEDVADRQLLEVVSSEVSFSVQSSHPDALSLLTLTCSVFGESANAPHVQVSFLMDATRANNVAEALLS